MYSHVTLDIHQNVNTCTYCNVMLQICTVMLHWIYTRMLIHVHTAMLCYRYVQSCYIGYTPEC